MTSLFELDRKLIEFSDSKDIRPFTIRDAVEGIQIFGGIGSGKSSGSGALIASKYISAGFGGLVLTCKSDEKKMWQEYCRKANRLDSLMVIEPGGNHTFNFLDYESSKKLDGITITENVVQVLKTVIQSSEEKSSGKSDDPFWESALDMLLFSVIDLCLLAYTNLSIQDMYSIVMTAPKKELDVKTKEKSQAGSFIHAFECAQNNVDRLVFSFVDNLSKTEKEKIKDAEYFEQIIINNIPEAALLKSIDQFFIETFRNLSEKTRSIIEFSFSGFLFRLLKEPVYSLFCHGVSTVKPEDCFKGKIILINLPVKTYQKMGRDCQVLFKYIWQKSVGSREATETDRPLFLWADEAQHFIHQFDSEYQATARSSKIATVYISQNLSNYHANLGGAKSEYRVKSFLGTLATKIFHSNADIETNMYASNLIGEAYSEDTSATTTMSGNFSSSRSKSFKLEKMARPEEFVGLMTGGPLNNYLVQGYMHRQGTGFGNGLNFKKIFFKQQ
jgi:hypothetical protein